MLFNSYRGLLLSLLLWQAGCSIPQKQVASYSSSYTIIDSSFTKAIDLESILQPYRQRVDSLMNVIIGHTAVPMSKAQPECTIGNFIADAQLEAARQLNPSVEISVVNYGGIRLPYISPGPITRGKIFELMPFDSKLTLLEIPGKTLQEFCNHMAAYGGWPISGMSYQIKDKKAVNILIMDKPLNPQLVYITATLDYVANGGDNCDFLKDCKRTNYSLLIRDILIDNIVQLNSKNQKLHPLLENRVSYVE